MTEWDSMVAIHDLFVPDWVNTPKGSTVSVVVDCTVHTDTMVLGVTVPDAQKVRLYGEINSQVRGCRRLSVLDAVLDFSPGSLDLLITDASMVVAHGLSPARDMLRVVELCAGVSCSSVGLCAAGFEHIGSVEWRPPLAQLHASCHPDTPVITGDITQPSCMRALLQQFKPPFSLMSGISCQPYSSGGSQSGSDDVRSNTLPATVKACYLCQSPLLIIECVTQARSNRFVKSILQALESQLGYHLSEVSLKLEDNWVARRYRWWVVASHPSLGPMPVPDWPKSPGLCIRDIMPYIRQWPAEDLRELLLTEGEAHQFTLDGSTLRKYVMQPDGKLPTCLHSWGSQASECPCGCRLSGFSDTLVRQRGIYAQLIQVTRDDGTPWYRHVHPCELALMNAMPPPHAWLQADRPSLRLSLCAIGQLASPLQSLWIGANVMQRIHSLLDFPAVCPKAMMSEFKSRLFACSKDLYPGLSTTPMPVSNWVQLIHLDGTSVHIQVSPETTFAELCQAELALTQQHLDGSWCDATTRIQLEANDPIAGRCIRVLPDEASQVAAGAFTHDPSLEAQLSVDVAEALADVPSGPVAVWVRKSASPDELIPSAAGPIPDAMHGLKHLTCTQLVAMLPPLVSDVAYCQVLRQSTVLGSARLGILANEETAMANDELTLHIRACLKLSGREDIQLLDPLLALGWLRAGDVDKVRLWLSQFPTLTSIVSAVLLHDHWIPVMWTVGLAEVQVTIWEHADTDIDSLCPLHGLISSAWNRPMFSVACTRRVFGRHGCGAAVVAFLASKLLSKDLPKNEQELMDLHTDLKCSFAAALHDVESVPKPWCWGFGVPDVVDLATAILQTHGVPAAQAPLRAKLVVQTLGKQEVQKALNGIAPWKSLKALANMQTPHLQLVLPDELHAQNLGKQPAKPKKAVGSSKKLLPAKPADLDPTKLVIAPATFRAGDDDPVGQLPLASVGPLATGIALATLTEAQQFLTAGTLLTNQGLALLIVNPPNEIQTSLQWSSIRFAARCSMNHELMLLPGILVQLGQKIVYPYQAKDTPAIASAEVACARITVYQDQWEGDWEDFATRPVKQILGFMPCLHTCRQGSTCTCQGWHPQDSCPHEALLDVFRRQFLTEAGRPVKWDKASHFAVMIRYAKKLEEQVLGTSGAHGVFVEPKTEDGLKPNDAFQVVWLPHLDFAEASHKARCEVHCIGLARAGKRYGLRVATDHFQQVFRSIKPDAVYLAPGSRRTFVCGPWPFGSDRKGIAKILLSSGWESRPLQPLHHVPGGLMWSIQALTDPPCNVLPMQHGQVVITCQDDQPSQTAGPLDIVGQAKTVQMCRNAEPTSADPWLVQDPWSKAVSSMPTQPSAPPATNVLHEMEQRLEQSLLAKIQATPEPMEVDCQEQRMQALEMQVQQLSTRQGQLEATVNDHHVQNTAQVQSLQQQMLAQFDVQSKQMQHMLSDQMSRIETILSKKPRTE